MGSAGEEYGRSAIPPIAKRGQEVSRPQFVGWSRMYVGELRPNVRYHLVAKHIVAKYGGTEMEDLFVHMPPFEMVKVLFLKAVQRRRRDR